MKSFLIHAFACARCGTGFILVRKSPPAENKRRRAVLEASPCRVCGKTDVEYLGKVKVQP